MSDGDPLSAEIADCRSALQLIVEKAAAMLLDRSPRLVCTPQAGTDLDHAVDELLRKELGKLLGVPILSEEGTEPELTSHDVAWIVDPIDGTLNAVVGHPEVAISVALVATHGWTPLVGALVAPFHNLSFSAARGLGATCNGTALSPSQNARPSIVAIGLPEDAVGRAHDVATTIERLVSRSWILRQTGSAALDVCRVALGQWRGFYEAGLYLWDVAAADLVVRKAGCVSIWLPSEFDGPGARKAYRVDYLTAFNQPTLDELANLTGLAERVPQPS